MRCRSSTRCWRWRSARTAPTASACTGWRARCTRSRARRLARTRPMRTASLAGIMGGQVSEVSDDTTRVAMEMATWVGPNISRTQQKLGLRTEASARFEKQLHPEQAIRAQRLAARLMVELCGARMVPGTIDVYPRPKPPVSVLLRVPRVEALLGVRVALEEIQTSLERLG